MNVLLQLGSTESIKLFLENSDALGILSIRAVTRELMAGRLKVIDIEGFKAERTFSFVEPQGQNSGMEESFMRLPVNIGNNFRLFAIKTCEVRDRMKICTFANEIK